MKEQNKPVRKSIGVNAILSSTKTLVSLIFPILVFPYVSHVLQVDNVGRYNFANSIIGYLSLTAGLGVSTYAVREGAKYREDREKISAFSSELLTLNIISTLLSYILLFIIMLIPTVRRYDVLLLILSIKILLATLGCEWIYSIFEEYKYITIRGIALQVVYAVLIFAFVKTSDDLIIYSWITLVSTSLGNLINMFFLNKFCRLRPVFSKKILVHLAPVLIIFANTLTTTIYTNSDITILGFMTSDYNVGLYSVSVKIYNIVKQLLAAIIIVSIPRLSMMWGQGLLEEFKELLNKIFSFLLILLVPAVIGLFCLSSEIIYIMAGDTYAGAVPSLQLLCAALFFSIFSWFYTSCVLIPCKREKEVLTATVISAAANILLNLVLIPFYKENAAAFTTVAAELISMVICCACSLKIVSIKLNTRDVLSTVISGILICAVCVFFKHSLYGVSVTLLGHAVNSAVLICACSVAVSMLLFAVVSLAFKNTVVTFFIRKK